MTKDYQLPPPPANVRDWTVAGVIGETVEIAFVPSDVDALVVTPERASDANYDPFGKRWISSGAPNIAAGRPNPNPFAKT
ncbi:hypothetical protein IVB41_08225 [Bradyrhizobium sp. 44]|uniref:hypothetical protein n=1 Tax=Bradyrhizobium sp. 44 TaxID=2782675 RepID=UPI001FF9E695|nr:hypothetical protein [Bradyrhizobium sp. 44]MCK1283923.1 hypothetical protein [Bradyrhizobium sp. 44]